MSHSKAMEIEDLLGRLSDVNDSLSSSLSGASDPRSHTLARHRDILHDYTQARSSLMQHQALKNLFHVDDWTMIPMSWCRSSGDYRARWEQRETELSCLQAALMPPQCR